MDLAQHQRLYYFNYIRPLFIKQECEECGSIENLELHHVDMFSKLLKETLLELNLEYKDTEEYKNNELNNITNVMLGKQIRIEYKTLCRLCHEHIHKSKNDINSYKYKVNKNNVEFLKEYLKSITGEVMLQVKDRKELVEKIDVKSNGKLLRSKDSLNNALQEMELPYKIIELNKITKIENGKKKQYKTPWKLIKTE